jgi:sulfatase modifying factor 1
MKLRQLFILLMMVWSFSIVSVPATGQEGSEDISKFMKNVVQLTVTFSDNTTMRGFGFIVGEQDVGKPDRMLYVLTANHVVRSSVPGVKVKEIKAKFCSYRLKSYLAELLEVADPELDFAVLEVQKPMPKFQWETQFFDQNPAAKSEAWFIGFKGECEESGAMMLNKVTYKGMSVLNNQVQPGTSGAPLISKQGIVGMITQSQQGSAEAVKIAIIRQIAEEAGVPWGLQEFATLPTLPPPTLPPTAIPTATPTATPTVKPPTPMPTATSLRVTPTPTTVPSSEGPGVGEAWKDPITGMEFVGIPKGCFQMGSPASEPDRDSEEEPVHQVCLDGFWMGKYEVTQAQWRKIMGNNPSNFQGDTRPVERVSWNDVQTFLQTLNKKSGKNPPLPLPGGEFRLPTEAEWEYAARAGTQTAYSFGNDANQLGDYAWYGANSGNRTHPVGQLKPNGFGLYDMHGNVSEWCQDWYDSYLKESVSNPQGPDSGSSRVIRGGSWSRGAGSCRSAVRSYDAPDDRFDSLGRGVGFRLLRTPE